MSAEARVHGRPCMFDELRAKKICDAIAAGNTRRCAAAMAGVSPSTVKNWMQRGRGGEEPFVAFLARVKKADAQAEAAAVRIILDAAKQGTWQAAAWFLERRHRAWRRTAVEQREPAQEAQSRDLATFLAKIESGEISTPPELLDDGPPPVDALDDLVPKATLND